ncbi:SMI1/KNR4 family protein [Streptomyces carpinensis]|uniref:SMI1/KNR4 family protein n=1 Tax=Streptomyces carpinensis TaxID=66369 RepID=A0ABV1WC48_9ACTN|nr:SMI1/KNR4 family protein [Streptomyces carpinensis]
MLDAEFERLRGRLEALDRPVVAWMVPGVDADHVSSVLGEEVPESVAQWFRWCNGIAVVQGQIQDQVNVIPGYSPLSLEEGMRMRTAYTGDDALGSHWVPLLGSGGGDLYAAVWTPGEEAVVAGVLVGEPTEIEFSTIEQMVTTFNECFDSGAFFVDDQGRLAMSPETYDEVYARVVGP